MRERGPLFHEDKGEEIMYELIKKDGRAKRGRFHTVHGTIETPVFMNVGTAAAIKERYRQMISGESRPRWSFQTRITCMSVREMKW